MKPGQQYPDALVCRCGAKVDNLPAHYEAAHGGVPAARVVEPFVLRECGQHVHHKAYRLVPHREAVA